MSNNNCFSYEYGYIYRGANIENGAPIAIYRFGKSKRIAARIATHEREHGAGNLVCIAPAGSKFETLMKELFSKHLISSNKGASSESTLRCCDETTEFFINLLESKHVVPNLDFIDDLPLDTDIDSWFFEDADHKLPRKIILNREGLYGYEDLDIRLQRAIREFKKDSDSFILSDVFATAVRAVLGPEFGDAFSEAFCNVNRIHAKRFYTKNTNALNNAHDWWPNTLVNPDSEQRPAAFEKLKDQIIRGIVQQSIIYMKPDQISTKYYQTTIMDFVSASFCPLGRIGLEHNYKSTLTSNRRPEPIVNKRRAKFQAPAFNSSATAGHFFLYIGHDPIRFLTIFTDIIGKGESILRAKWKKNASA